MDMSVSLVSGMLELKNPILSASGTFGSGLEYQLYGDITQLGGIITNGITLHPRAGAPMPRIVETAGGMLSAVGTQNDGAAHFLDTVLPSLPWQEVPVIPNLNASNIEEFSELAAFFSGQEAIAAVEINLSCCNDHRGGQRFCQNPVTAARAVNAVKRAFTAKPVIAKISPQVMDMVEIAKALSRDCRIILMDEPSTALDPVNRRTVINTINDLPQTKLIASHDLDMILDTCQRVILLSHGKIVADGDAETILRDRELLEANRMELPFCLQGWHGGSR